MQEHRIKLTNLYLRKIYRGKGKYCSRGSGGLGSPKIYERNLTSQLAWVRKCVHWSKNEGEVPFWFLPFKALLKKYWLPQCHFLFLMGRGILEVVGRLCEHEGLFIMSEILAMLLEARKKCERKLISETLGGSR